MSLNSILEFIRPAHKVPHTIWSSDTPLTLKPRFVTLLFLISGLWIFGTGEAILIDAGIGVSPWTVLAQGISKQADLTVGMATFVVSVLVLFLWIPLRETPGIGTILNAILIAMSIDVMAPFIPNQTDFIPQIIQASIGIILVGIGSALYLTANLGPGPRDGWMTGVQKKTNWPIGRVRVGIEIIVLSIGIALGGTFGLGTVMFAIGIGPAISMSLGVVSNWEK
ncbi:MAG: YitT family protein [Candidatus Poseidoniia archaeon]|nr:YitT family protein [Candidatus Poseidoniia archaeon]